MCTSLDLQRFRWLCRSHWSNRSCCTFWTSRNAAIYHRRLHAQSSAHGPRPTSDVRPHRTPYRRDRCSWAPSLTTADEDPFFRAVVRTAQNLGVVHAERGDGGLTDAESATLDAAPLVTVVTISGAVFFLPDEAPRQIAEVTAAALEQASRS
jgi:hypothetical protein